MEHKTTPEDIETSIQRQEQVLDRQLSWIGAVDGKLPTIIGLATAMLAALGVVAPGPDKFGWFHGMLIAFGGGPLFLCLWYCAKVTFPVTEGPAGSMIFFGGIASLPLSQYCEKATIHTNQDHFHDLCRQIYRNAQIASMKYQYVQVAMRYLFGGTAAWLVAGYLLYKE